MSPSWPIWYALLVVLPVSIMALFLKPGRVVRWLRLGTIGMIAIALGLWLGHIFALQHHHDRPLVVSSAGVLRDASQAEVAALATFSIALMKNSKCAGGVIVQPAWRKLPARFIATPSNDPKAVLLWLSNAVCRTAAVNDAEAIFDLQPAQGISLAWVHEWPVAAPAQLHGRWANGGSMPPSTPSVSAR